MSKSSRAVIYSLLLFVFYLLFKAIITLTALSSVAMVGVDAAIDHDDVVSVYYATGLGNVSFTEEKSLKTEVFKKNQRVYARIFLHNNIARKLRIDIGEQSGTVKIYKIVVNSFFGPKLEFTPQEIYKQFQPNGSVDLIELKNDHVTISSNGNDPYLVFKNSVSFQNRLLEYIVPFFFSVVAVICISSFSLSTFPAIFDIRNKKSSAGMNYTILDGFRGVAALLVLCEHSGVMAGVGPLGVWIFFTLSGFLLAIPFIHEPRKAISATYLKTYILRRILRIVPMYYCLITMYFLFRGHEITAIRHYLFLQGDIHLWTIPQEMLFYLLLPLIMFVGCIIAGKRKVLVIIYIFILIIISNKYLTVDRIALYAYGKNMVFLVGIFLSGVLFSYIYHWVVSLDVYKKNMKSIILTVASCTGCILFIGLGLTSAGWLDNMGTANDNPMLYGFLSAMIIFLVLISENTRLSRIFTFFPLRAVGVVGFSFYLLHPLVIWAVQGVGLDLLNYRPGGVLMFCIAGVLTYIFAAVTYTYIERPFLKINSR